LIAISPSWTTFNACGDFTVAGIDPPLTDSVEKLAVWAPPMCPLRTTGLFLIEQIEFADKCFELR
jgi:hypothetical protein